MFWTDWGYIEPKIERADLTGENRQIVLDLGYGWDYQLFPMSVVIDYEAERIYWMDAYDNYIDSADLDGYDRTNVHYISQNIFPADLALHGDNLYWVDWNSQSIQWFNKTQPLTMLNFGHLSDVYLTGVVVSDDSRQPVGKYILVKNNSLHFICQFPITPATCIMLIIRLAIKKKHHLVAAVRLICLRLDDSFGRQLHFNFSPLAIWI